jgi:hypothetical protein
MPGLPDPPEYPSNRPSVPRWGEGDDLDRRPACLDHPHRDWWFPDSIHAAAGRAAASAAAWVCVGCPVLIECARFSQALLPPSGVWAGRWWVAVRDHPDEGRPSRIALVPDLLLPPITDPDIDPKHAPPKVPHWLLPPTSDPELI